MKKKIMAGAVGVCAAACLAITVFAANSVTMSVNNVNVTGSHSHSGNKVTASVSAEAALDDIYITPFVTDGKSNGQVITKVGKEQHISIAKKYDTSISAPFLTTSCGGGAKYRVYHNGDSDTGETSTCW